MANDINNFPILIWPQSCGVLQKIMYCARIHFVYSLSDPAHHKNKIEWLGLGSWILGIPVLSVSPMLCHNLADTTRPEAGFLFHLFQDGSPPSHICVVYRNPWSLCFQVCFSTCLPPCLLLPPHFCMFDKIHAHSEDGMATLAPFVSLLSSNKVTPLLWHTTEFSFVR